jgi:hypothetical protein
MLQKNSFFSSPLIFYGSHQDSEDDEDDEMQDNDDWNCSESWIVAVNSRTQHIQQNKIGLFIHWVDPMNE